jgi:hypothetical protein
MLELRKFEKENAARWDQFVDKSENGTLFHTLKFLSYHKERFSGQENHIAWYKGEALFAVMPFAVVEKQDVGLTGISPYGASFGGIIYKHLDIKSSDELISKLVDYCRQENLARVQIGIHPSNYFKKHNEYLSFMLLKHGFRLASKEVFNVIPLAETFEECWEQYEGRCRTSIRKASVNFQVKEDVDAEEFYPILVEDKIRHNSSPTHSLEELKFIKAAFPEKVWFDVAVHNTTGAKAGVCYFQCNENTILTFYISQQTAIKSENGASVLLNQGIKKALKKGCKYFDFGGSSLGYDIPNIGVPLFKESFGATCYSRDLYILDLN